MNRLERLEARRIDDSLMVDASLAGEVYKRMQGSDAVRYTIGAMQPIDPEYTANTFRQGARVMDQLSERLAGGYDFRYQGSTATDTHIKARSDIDLLLIHRRWFWLEPPQRPRSPYEGNPADDMRAIRRESSHALTNAFPAADVDTSNSTAIKMSGGSLTRQIDVVPASWFNTLRYAETGKEVYRGVEVFDNGNGVFIRNMPFLHARLFEEQDQRTRGGLRKATRLMKSLRYDSDGRCAMSSYNIMSIAYNMPIDGLMPSVGRELVILESCYEFCASLVVDPALRSTVIVPDGHRGVFGEKPGASQSELEALTKELYDLRIDVLRENARSFAKLAEARVDYALPGF